jgi:peroxiredoxin
MRPFNFYTALFLVLATLFMNGCGTEKQKKLSIGDKAPDFTVKSLDGEIIKLSEWLGKPVILRFWSTECKYCRADTPAFNHYFERYKDKGLRVVYVNTEEESTAIVKEFVKDLEIPFPVVMEGGREMGLLYNVKIVPQTIIIDPEGVILTAILGAVGEAELQELVGRYLTK